MKYRTIGIFVGLVATAAVGLAGAQQSEAEFTREMRDRVQIEDLMWRYTRALDTNDPDAYAAAYTPDGQFGSGANAAKGREALRKMIADLRQRNADARAKGQPAPPMYHMTANERITFSDKDHARIEAYYITAIAAAGPNTPLRIVSVGRSVDELVRVNGQWLIKSRNVAPQD